MGILNNNDAKKNMIDYDITVSSVKAREKGYSFTLTVNGVTIYQMRAYDYKNSQGEEKVSINFPSYKYNNEFVNYVFFPMSHEIREKIITELSKQIAENK